MVSQERGLYRGGPLYIINNDVPKVVADNSGLVFVYGAFNAFVLGMPPLAYISAEVQPFSNFTTILSENLVKPS